MDNLILEVSQHWTPLTPGHPDCRNNVSSDVWSQAEPRLNPTLMGSSQHFWFTTFLPRIAFVSTHKRCQSLELTSGMVLLV